MLIERISMNKKIHKTKKQKIKLTPPQRGHLQSGQKESAASKDVSEEVESSAENEVQDSSFQEQPLGEEKQK